MIIRRFVGILFVIAAMAGVIFSILGLIGIWRYRAVVTQTVLDNLALSDQALGTTQQVLTIAGQVVQATTTDVASMQATTQAVALAIHNTNPMLDSLVSLTQNDLPAAVSATQTSLASAQSSALLIDNVLTALTSIPFSPITYKPTVPLHTALAQVSTSMDSLLPSLAVINSSLTDGQTNLDTMNIELTKISATTQGISSTLSSAQTVIDQYKATTSQLKANVETAQRQASAWILITAWIMSFFLGWLLIVQLGLGMQGLDLVRGHRDAK
jgi:hypothetical protein